VLGSEVSTSATVTRGGATAVFAAGLQSAFTFFSAKRHFPATAEPGKLGLPSLSRAQSRLVSHDRSPRAHLRRHVALWHVAT
jgi:hypothetical protein